MATTNTESIPTPHTNGVIEDGYDEEDKSKMRPADIDADMREMERRKRVELIMNSRLFREELERIIESQMRDGNNSAGLLQQISDMVGSRYNNHFFRNTGCAVPINDIRGLEAMGFVKGEKILRCKLAALFRLIDLYGWSQNIYNHVTARLSQQEEHFLVNPYGLLYSEVTASSLAKVDMQGNVIESGTTNFCVSVAGFKLHAAIYAARPDLKCIVHVHTPSVLAISSLKSGLLPLCQEAAVIGEISLYAYTGIPTDSEERDKITRSLGPNNKVIFLTNHGALCCGETIEETFFNAYNTVNACETQLKVMPLGKDNLLLLSEETRKTMYDTARKMPENIASNASSTAAVSEKRWRVGGLEFEALMRMLDNSGFRTGYVYRTPLIKGELPRPRNDVEVPPAVSSLGYLFEEEELYKQGVWRKHFGVKGNDRTRWLNSPNVYQKVEILETGTTDPKKITKWVGPNNEEWVAEGSPSHTSTPVKIENALQFVPKNTNPKEFKKLQQQIKDNRRADKITSGPQSHILEGVSWEEAKKLQDANMSGTSDQVILVGAASKGIIQREFQHNATVYKTPYAKNPFDAVTDEELENYKKDITRKQRGSSYYDEDESDAFSSSLPAKGITSETEDDSLHKDARVIRIQTSTAPKESRAEVVLSDDGKKSKNRLMHSLGSMLTLRREFAKFVDTVDVLYTSIWEMCKQHPALCVVVTVRVVSYPRENTKPRIVYLVADEEKEAPPLNLDLIVSSYRDKSHNMLRSKVAFKQVVDELMSKFRSGELFRRAVSASIRSFDSSEVEYTILTEIPPKNYNRMLAESLHDFSSTSTTEDEEEASSPDRGELKPALSLSSLTSCIGTEYEEWKAPQLDSIWAEAPELTTSFRSTSDEDVTVIYCPSSSPVGIREMMKNDENCSDDTDDLSISLSSDEDDEGTYSRMSEVDYDDIHSINVPFNESATSLNSRDARFRTELSVIYEEDRAEGGGQKVPTKISESSEGTETVQLSGYESASTLDTDSFELDDSSILKLSPGRSEMTWTVDDLSSVDECDDVFSQNVSLKTVIAKTVEEVEQNIGCEDGMLEVSNNAEVSKDYHVEVESHTETEIEQSHHGDTVLESISGDTEASPDSANAIEKVPMVGESCEDGTITATCESPTTIDSSSIEGVTSQDSPYESKVISEDSLEEQNEMSENCSPSMEGDLSPDASKAISKCFLDLQVQENESVAPDLLPSINEILIEHQESKQTVEDKTILKDSSVELQEVREDVGAIINQGTDATSIQVETISKEFGRFEEPENVAFDGSVHEVEMTLEERRCTEEGEITVFGEGVLETSRGTSVEVEMILKECECTREGESIVFDESVLEPKVETSCNNLSEAEESSENLPEGNENPKERDKIGCGSSEDEELNYEILVISEDTCEHQESSEAKIETSRAPQIGDEVVSEVIVVDFDQDNANEEIISDQDEPNISSEHEEKVGEGNDFNPNNCETSLEIEEIPKYTAQEVGSDEIASDRDKDIPIADWEPLEHERMKNDDNECKVHNVVWHSLITNTSDIRFEDDDIDVQSTLFEEKPTGDIEQCTRDFISSEQQQSFTPTVTVDMKESAMTSDTNNEQKLHKFLNEESEEWSIYEAVDETETSYNDDLEIEHNQTPHEIQEQLQVDETHFEYENATKYHLQTHSQSEMHHENDEEDIEDHQSEFRVHELGQVQMEHDESNCEDDQAWLEHLEEDESHYEDAQLWHSNDEKTQCGKEKAETSYQYDCNQNKLPSEEEVTRLGSRTTTERRSSSECGDFSLNLSLHIEWDDQPNSCEPSPGHDVASNVEDPKSPQHHARSWYILKDFKQNYPKFIQYSDFSPKIKSKGGARKWPFTPRCKRGATSWTRGSKSAPATRRSNKDGDHVRFSKWSVDWSKAGRGKRCRCDLRSDASFKTSTPHEEEEKNLQPRLSPNATSLEEFEILELLCKSK